MFTRRRDYTPQKNGDAQNLRELEFTPLGIPNGRSRRVGTEDAFGTPREHSPPLVEYGRNAPVQSTIVDMSELEDTEHLSFAAETSLHYIPNNAIAIDKSVGASARAMQLGPPLKDSEEKAAALQHEINSLRIRNSMLKRLTSNIPMDAKRLAEENIGLKESLLNLENELEALRLQQAKSQSSHESEELRKKVSELTSRLENERSGSNRMRNDEINGIADKLHHKEELLIQTEKGLELERQKTRALEAQLESMNRKGEDSIFATQQLHHKAERLDLAERELESERRKNRVLLDQLANANRDISDTKRAAEERESILRQSLSKEVALLKQQLMDSEKSLQNYKQESVNVQQIRDELTHSEGLVRNLRSELASLTNNRNNSGQQSSTQVRVLEDKLASAHEEIRSRDRQIIDLTSLLSSLEQTMNQIHKPRLESLEQELSAANRRCRDMESQESELAWSKQQIVDLKKRCDMLQTNSAEDSRAIRELASLRSKHDKLQATHQQLVRDHDKEVSASTTEITLLKRRLEETRQEQEILRRKYVRQIEQLERDLRFNTAKAEASSTKSNPDAEELRRLSRDNASLLDQILDLNITIGSLKAEKAKLYRECDDLRSRCERLHSDKGGFNSHNQELVEAFDKVRGELAATKAAYKTAQEENEALIAKQRELSSKIDANASRLHEMSSEYRNHDYRAQELEQKLSVAKLQLAAAQEVQRRSQEENTQLSADLKEARRAVSSAKDECESLRRRLATANGFLENVADTHMTDERLRDLRNQYEHENEDLRRHLASAEGLISLMQYLLDVDKPGDIEADIKELLDSNRYLRDQFRSLKSRVEDYENGLFLPEATRKNLDDFTYQMKELQALLAEKEAQRMKLASECEQVQTVLDSAEMRVQSLEREQETLRHDLERKVERINALELNSRLSSDTQRELTELRLSKMRDETRIRELECNLDVARKNETRIKELEAELRSARLDATSYRERVEKLQMLQYSDDKLDDALKVLLEMDLKESQAQNKKLEAQLSRATGKVKDMQEQVTDLELQLMSSQAENDIVSHKTPQSTLERQQHEGEIARLKDELKTMSLYCNKLRDKLSHKVRETATLTQALDKARTEAQCKQAVVESESNNNKAKLYELKAEYYESLFTKTATRVRELKELSRITNATVKSMTLQQQKDIVALTPVASPDLKPYRTGSEKPTFKTVAQFVVGLVRMQRRAKEAKEWYQRFENLGISLERENLKLTL